MSDNFSVRKRVEFADTDVAGIMHFANFFRFMEVCEHAFMRSLGFSVHPSGVESGKIDLDAEVGWPRVHASCEYKKPLRFEQEVEIELRVEKVNARTVDYGFSFWKNPDDEESRTLVATGKFIVVCVNWDEESKEMKAVEIPSGMREKLEKVCAE
ncbi:MAG: acyl-CoA thioesterase [Verrucomicrobia bacterium]|nr:acyl-CoA thioesterase [Verrucomicrobiota bacterium]